ncbi:hypothetical protein N0V88_002163 [Collariella sp. IMI 366227]|nr:hypothetical protein N0V88_002163 [Collariella sp. IMI 366227]
MTTPVWTPVDAAEKALKEAFTGLNDAATKAIVQGVVDAPNRFVLNTKGYYDLRAYVLSGKSFPTSTAEFQSKMPKSAFLKLTTIDPDIYNARLPPNTLVNIGSTCAAYHANHLAKLGTAAVKYSENTLSLLEDDGLGLLPQIEILLDPKYRNKASQDQVFEDAREGAQMTLTLLKDEATSKEVEVKEVLKSLIAFRENTALYLTDVQYLNKQYITGPVTNNSTMKTPYLKFLNDKVAADLAAVYSLAAEVQGTQAEYEKAKNIAIGTAFAGVIGWVFMGIYSKKAVDLEAKVRELQSQISVMANEWQEGSLLVTYVGRVVKQCDDIDDKMDVAIKAMTELAALFSEASYCYDKISFNLKGMWTGTDSDSAANRKAYITKFTKDAITKLKELKGLASEFAEAIIRNYDLTKSA